VDTRATNQEELYIYRLERRISDSPPINAFETLATKADGRSQKNIGMRRVNEIDL
jgi:hypothetical protein